MHKGCLEKGLVNVTLRCARCEALRWQMKSYGVEEVKKRISRIEWTLSNGGLGAMRRKNTL